MNPGYIISWKKKTCNIKGKPSGHYLKVHLNLFSEQGNFIATLFFENSYTSSFFIDCHGIFWSGKVYERPKFAFTSLDFIPSFYRGDESDKDIPHYSLYWSYEVCVYRVFIIHFLLEILPEFIHSISIQNFSSCRSAEDDSIIMIKWFLQ